MPGNAPPEPRTGWTRIAARSDTQIERLAAGGPDNPPTEVAGCADARIGPLSLGVA
jgi:hypothetical protein